MLCEMNILDWVINESKSWRFTESVTLQRMLKVSGPIFSTWNSPLKDLHKLIDWGIDCLFFWQVEELLYKWIWLKWKDGDRLTGGGQLPNGTDPAAGEWWSQGRLMIHQREEHDGHQNTLIHELWMWFLTFFSRTVVTCWCPPHPEWDVMGTQKPESVARISPFMFLFLYTVFIFSCLHPATVRSRRKILLFDRSMHVVSSEGTGEHVREQSERVWGRIWRSAIPPARGIPTQTNSLVHLLIMWTWLSAYHAHT